MNVCRVVVTKSGAVVESLGTRFEHTLSVWFLVGNGGVDPYDAPLRVPYSGPYNPFPHSPLRTRQYVTALSSWTSLLKPTGAQKAWVLVGAMCWGVLPRAQARKLK